jgi:hypothetical protein
MWIEGHLATIDDWLLGISRNEGYDPELDGDVSYFSIGFGLFSISFIFKK